jgi:hypothetical protein
MPSNYRVNLKDEEAFALQVSTTWKVKRFDKLGINFLRKWSVEQFQVVTLGVGVGGFPIANLSAAMPQIDSYLGACLAIECNTRPVAEPLTADQQAAALFDGLQLTSDAIREYRLDVEGFGNAKTTH